jgi:hypothetical protein
MATILHRIKATLFPNLSTEDPNDFYAKVISERTLNIDEICDSAVGLVAHMAWDSLNRVEHYPHGLFGIETVFLNAKFANGYAKNARIIMQRMIALRTLR